jgi:hypothetical protein
VLSIAFSSAACLVIHELAHALAALCCGGGVREFVLLSVTPHVQVNGTFTWSQHSWICVAGSLAEILLFPLALVAAPRSRAGRIAIDVTGIFAGIELIGWTLSALAYPQGPRDTDVWKFLAASGFHPWTVPGACAAAAVLCAMGYRMRVSAQA